jgi:uncharacterized RDD family membrane protein YckC
MLLFTEAVMMPELDITQPDQLAAMLEKTLNGFLLECLFASLVLIGFWMYFGSSPGKLLFKGYIVDAKTLQPASRWQLIVRSLAYYISLIPMGLGFIWIGLDSRKQGWHDKLAGTVVISRHKSDRDAS